MNTTFTNTDSINSQSATYSRYLPSTIQSVEAVWSYANGTLAYDYDLLEYYVNYSVVLQPSQVLRFQVLVTTPQSLTALLDDTAQKGDLVSNSVVVLVFVVGLLAYAFFQLRKP